MNKDLITVSTCITIIAVALIFGAFNYETNKQNNMAKNIEAAIAKGVDPISVKCAYETSSNPVCITYAATTKK